MRIVKCVLSAIILGLCVAANFGSQDSRPTDGDFKCYFGVLHSNTVLSPDFEPQPDRDQLASLVASNDPARFTIPNGPMAAWERAADQAKLDFLALTDHIHGPEPGEGEPCSHEMPPGGYK